MRLAISCLIVFAMYSGAEGATAAQSTDTSASALISAISGNLPIILSAPHGGKEPIPGVSQRQGSGVARFSTGRDTRTDDLADLLALELEKKFNAKPFVVIARFERRYVDVNRASDAAFESVAVKSHYDGYHHALGEFVQRVGSHWGSGLLVDLHGEGTDADAIYRGTQNGKTVKSLIQRFGPSAVNGNQSISGQMAKLGYRVLPGAASNEKETHYLGGYIVQTYGSHQPVGIDAMQLELGANLRARANLEKTARNLAQAIEVFARAYLATVNPNNRLPSAP